MREQLKDISAIIGQRLNTACRMWKGSVSPDISIVYSEDSVNWHNYLLECFSQIPDDGNDVTPLTVNSIMLETQEIPVAKKDAEALASSRVQLIILSPDFLDFVTSNSGDVFHVGRLLDPDRIVAMLCGVEPTDVNDVHRSALVTYDFWKNKLSVVDQDKDFVIEVLKKTAEILCDVNGVHNNKSKSFRVTPRHVTRDKNKMYILLNKPIINVEKVKVTLHRRDEPDDDSGSTEVNVKIINPYTIQFYLAGSSVSSVIDVRVTCDDVDLGRQPICCVSRMGELARLLHTVTSSPVEFMYQSLGLNSDSHHVLDRHLTDGIKKHQACLGKLSLVDFDVDSCERLDRCEEMPTLLHFAARYGFAELCSALLDCIGATVAYQITDVHGMTAADVARSVGHNDIADTLAEFQSVCEANGIYLNLRRNDAKRQDATDAEDGKMSKDVMNIQLNDIPYIDCDEYVEMVGTKPENIGNDPNNVRSNISNSQYELIQMH